MKLKLFVILSRVPYPLEKGDKLRAFNQIKLLSKSFDIILFAMNDKKLDPMALEQLKRYCKAIKFVQLPKATIFTNMVRAFFSGLPFQVGYFYNPKIQKMLDEYLNKHQPDLIYCQLIRTSEYVKHVKHIPKVLDYMDVFSKGVERWAAKSSFPLSMILRMEYKRLLKYENTIFNYFDLKTIISEQDRALIFHPNNQQIKIIKNGVDMDFFYPQEITEQYDLLFSGNMNYPPNIDSALYLVNEILPIVEKNQKYKNIKLLIAGASPHKKILALQSSTITVSGWVEDIRECFSQSTIFIAPMQLSIGLQNKLLEAMAMKKPCITSRLANNAINAPEKDCILVASTPEEYAHHIITLLDNKEEAKRLAEKGYNFVLQNYNWEKITEDLSKNLREIHASFKKKTLSSR